MANSIVIIAVICYSTLLYIMDYYGIFIVYYDILLYIYILLLKSSLSLCHILAGSQFTGITQYNWVGTTLIQGLQGCLKTTQRSHNSPIANTFCSTVQAFGCLTACDNSTVCESGPVWNWGIPS